MTTEKSLEEISDKLDKILKLLALDVVKGIEKDQAKIELLDSIGFRPVEIGKFLNKTTENISAQLSILRKKKDEKKTKRNGSNPSPPSDPKTNKNAVSSPIK